VADQIGGRGDRIALTVRLVISTAASGLAIVPGVLVYTIIERTLSPTSPRAKAQFGQGCLVTVANRGTPPGLLLSEYHGNGMLWARLRGAGMYRGFPEPSRLIIPGDPWDLGHGDYDRSRSSQPERRRCNRARATRHLRTSCDWERPKLRGVRHLATGQTAHEVLSVSSYDLLRSVPTAAQKGNNVHSNEGSRISVDRSSPDTDGA
jgi:hypothetical protein